MERSNRNRDESNAILFPLIIFEYTITLQLKATAFNVTIEQLVLELKETTVL